LWDVL
jgi:hypothetical protein